MVPTADSATLANLRSTFVPNRILAVAGEGAELESHAKLVPLAGGKVARHGAATAYVCEASVRAATTDPDVFARQIRRVKSLPGGGSGAAPSGGVLALR